MKKILFAIAAVIFSVTIFAQSPNKISYQAIIRDLSGTLVKSTNVGVKISIIQGSAVGNVVYREIHNEATNSNGLLSIEIGGGSVDTGYFATINWAYGVYFIKTEIDPMGGSNYSITAISQFLSVPYALFSNSSGNGFSGDYNDLTNKPLSKTNIIPRIAARGQILTVSFSGGDDLSFSQASPTCTDLYPDVNLVFSQGSPTIIYPVDQYFIDSKRFDAIFDIPSYVPSGLYDIILGPSSGCPYTIYSSFKIY